MAQGHCPVAHQLLLVKIQNKTFHHRPCTGFGYLNKSRVICEHFLLLHNVLTNLVKFDDRHNRMPSQNPKKCHKNQSIVIRFLQNCFIQISDSKIGRIIFSNAKLVNVEKIVFCQ